MHRVRRLAALVVPLFALAVAASVVFAQPYPYCQPGQLPQFVHGFKALSDTLGDTMGEPLECEHTEAATGDAHQQTTRGLAFYRKSTNIPTFTNGFEHWALTSHGLVYWTGESIDPPGIVLPSPTPTPSAIPATATPVPPSPTPTRGPLSEADIVAAVGPSVVQIVTSSSFGSGVKVAAGILTNEHVVRGQTRVTVVLSNGESVAATVVRTDEVRDLALLSANVGLPSVELEPARDQRHGDPVLVLGYPLGIGGQATVTRGLLSAVRQDVSGTTYVQTDAAVNPGNSGGPIVNIRGKLIALTALKVRDAEGLNFGIATESIQDFLAGKAPPPSPTATPVPRQEPVTRSGKNSEVTEPFHLVGGNYRLKWSANVYDSTWLSCWFIAALGSTDGQTYRLVVNEVIYPKDGTVSDATYIGTLYAGSYYFDVSAAGCTWSLTLEQVR